MIPILFILAATQAAQSAEVVRYEGCLAEVKSDPAKAAATASKWLAEGASLYGRQCLAQAQVAAGNWGEAAAAFEEAARQADRTQDSRRADFWVQAGNAWLAANDGAKARAALDAALATTALTSELRGEVHLDRARAGVALGDIAGARADLDKGLQLVPSDPFAWYLSAALAQREDKLGRAKSDIAKAVAMAPDDADVLLLAGNIAGLSGDLDGARRFYGRAARAAPGSPAARSAEAALAANPTSDESAKPVQPR